jgi:hypothetical protein
MPTKKSCRLRSEHDAIVLGGGSSEAGEWLQQATLVIRAHIPLDVLADTIQPFPTFSEIYVAALKTLRGEVAATCKAVGRRPGT